MFAIAVVGILINIAFYLLWPRIGNFQPCRGRATGDEVAFVVSALLFTLSLSGRGWLRLATTLASFAMIYLWFCSIAWKVQMQC
jgi:hypothetical protein